MGLKTSYLSFIEHSIEQTFGKDVNGLRMLELGDQVVLAPNAAEKTGKEYFTNRGCEHVSVDINGLHGATVRDLTKPEQFRDWHDSWDILTNSATTEHVEPFESQYDCFNIIHSCIKMGGIAIHLVPDVYERDERGAWESHCRYYYSESFFELLAEECGYELLSNTVTDGLRCAAARKTKNVPFMKDHSQFLASIYRRDNVARTVLNRTGAGKMLRRMGLR